MAKKKEHSVDFSKYAATAHAAKAIGSMFYFTGKRCTKGHLSLRYASSGNCSQCIADKRGKAEINHVGKSSKRSQENHRRALFAMTNGHLEYEPDSPCPNGHYKRFVVNNSCVECVKESTVKRSKKARWARIKKEYDLSESDVQQMLADQDNKCVICSVEITDGYHIDHCHKTGKVRGLLCQKCNQAIGLMKESELLFFKAAEYIKEHNATQTVSTTEHQPTDGMVRK